MHQKPGLHNQGGIDPLAREMVAQGKPVRRSVADAKGFSRLSLKPAPRKVAPRARAAIAAINASTKSSGALAPAVTPTLLTPSNQLQSTSSAEPTSRASRAPARLATSTRRTEFELLGEPITSTLQDVWLAQEPITKVLKYSVDLYKGLAAETGLDTGWKMTGSAMLAATARRNGPDVDRIGLSGLEFKTLLRQHRPLLTRTPLSRFTSAKP